MERRKPGNIYRASGDTLRQSAKTMDGRVRRRRNWRPYSYSLPPAAGDIAGPGRDALVLKITRLPNYPITQSQSGVAPFGAPFRPIALPRPHGRRFASLRQGWKPCPPLCRAFGAFGLVDAGTVPSAPIFRFNLQSVWRGSPNHRCARPIGRQPIAVRFQNQ